MIEGRPEQPLLFGDVVALAFDLAQRLTPNPRLAALLATIALDEVVPRSRRRRVEPRPKRPSYD
jgi:hypothetical protein